MIFFKSLWIIPIQKMNLLVSKFVIVLIYSLAFMSLSILFTILFGKIIHHIEIDYSLLLFSLESVLRLVDF